MQPDKPARADDTPGGPRLTTLSASRGHQTGDDADHPA